jgi:4'-phosphopantetheinyl transferase
MPRVWRRTRACVPPRASRGRNQLSRAEGVVAAAVAPPPVGVDAEPMASAKAPANLSQDVPSPAEASAAASAPDAEAALLMLWVRKEALVKLGVTVLEAMSDLDLSDLPLAPHGEVSASQL